MNASNNYLVLSQYRSSSKYDDQVGRRYHFPPEYFNLMTLPSVFFIYYEPSKKGAGEYFGIGRIKDIEMDPVEVGHSYATIYNFQLFENPVSFKKTTDLRYENSRYFNANNAVRRIEHHEYEEICLEGGIDPDAFGIEDENTSGGAILEPFDPSKIKVDREPMTIFQVMRKIEKNNINIKPNFQRNFVWDVIRQSRLIESILLKIPLPALYIDAVNPSKWVVVDGLQRLTTLRNFMHPPQKLRLTGLEYLKTLEGRNFDELPASFQRDLEDANLTLFLIRPETPAEVKFTIFARINTGGLVLNAQEIRHALFQGTATTILDTLAEHEVFLTATNRSINTDRMDDRECVLRFFAFRLTDFTSYDRSDLNHFLSNTMQQLNSLSDSEINVRTQEFLDSMTLCHSILGKYSFRKFGRDSNRRGPINKALFETWSNAVLMYDSKYLLVCKDDILEALENALYTDGEYIKSLSVSTGDKKQVNMRFQRTHEIIQKAIS